MSASTRPTRAPACASAIARLTATVDLPTPPLLLATATTLRTPGTGFGPLGRSGWLRTFAPIATRTAPTPGTVFTAASAARCRSSRTGQAGVVSTKVKATSLPSMARSWIIPRETISRCSSGSCTWERAESTASFVTVAGTVYFLAMFSRRAGRGAPLLAGRRVLVRGGIPRNRLSGRGGGVRAVRRQRLRLRHGEAAEVRGARAAALAANGTAEQAAQHARVPAAGGAVLTVELAVEAVVVADLEAVFGGGPLGEAAFGVQQLGDGGYALAEWQAVELGAMACHETVRELVEQQRRLLLSRKAGDLRGVEPAYF